MTAYGYQLRTITEPVVEPISLEEAKQQCQIDEDITERNADLELYIAAARELAENYTERSFCERAFRLSLDRFPTGDNWPADYKICLPRGPVIEVLSIRYTEQTGAEVTLEEDTDYTVAIDDEPPYIVPAYTEFWPIPRFHPGSVRIEYRAGYASSGSPAGADNVPPAVKQALRFLVAHWNENREAVTLAGGAPQDVPLGFYDALQKFRSYP